MMSSPIDDTAASDYHFSSPGNKINLVMTEELVLERGANQIRATLYGKFARGVLLCPPHPKYGGNRHDLRLVTIASELANSGIAALCLDYSAYTGGPEETKDAIFTLEHMKETMTSLGLLGYSYGAMVASNVAAQFQGLKGLALVSPLKRVNGSAIDVRSTCRKLIIYGLHDDLVAQDIEEIFNLSQGEKRKLSLDTDHFYFGYEKTLAQAAVEFFQEAFRSPG